MVEHPEPHFIDNTAIRGRESQYVTILVDANRIMSSLRESLFAFEWLLPDGRIKEKSDLPAAEQQKRLIVEQALGDGQPLQKPVLGIGLLDNVEIGAGRPVFLTLAAHGAKTIPVHVPASHQDEFRDFLARENAAVR